MTKRIIAATAALTIGLVGFGSAAAFADEEVAPSASISTPAASPTAPASEDGAAATPTTPTTEPETSGTPVSDASPSPTTEPNPPSSPTSSTPSPGPESSPSEPAPVVTTPAPVTTYTTVLWQMPGAVTTWPQKYVKQVEGDNLGAFTLADAGLLCDTSYQVDVYESDKVPALTADGILNEGEDYGVALHWTTFTTAKCEVTSPPVVTPPLVTPPVVTPPVVTPPVVVPPVDKPTPPAKPVSKPTPATIHTAVDRHATLTSAPVSAESELAYTGSRDMRAAAEAAVVTLLIGMLLMVGAGIARHRRKNV